MNASECLTDKGPAPPAWRARPRPLPLRRWPSPVAQLLLLSGVGPADELRVLGIAVLTDLPGMVPTCTTTR